MLTPRQANVMDHAVAYPKRYRNHFCATPGSPNDLVWKELVDLGFAKSSEHKLDSSYNVYSITESGIYALIKHHGDDQ